MIEIQKRVDCEIDTALLESIAKLYTKRSIELIITNNDEIQTLNTEYRGINRSTDVLSFPLDGKKKDPLGSIVISCDFVKDAAKRFGHLPKEELTLLFIHGLLHLLGYDHEIDSGEMRAEEEKLIKKFSLPNSLIVRSEA